MKSQPSSGEARKRATSEDAQIVRRIGAGDNAALAELYDRVEDPAERENLAAEREDELQHYRGLAEAYLADDEPPWGVRAGVVELGEMQLNQLKALGYHVE